MSALWPPLRLLLRWLITSAACPALPEVPLADPEGAAASELANGILGPSRVALWGALTELAASLAPVSDFLQDGQSSIQAGGRAPLVDDLQLAGFAPLECSLEASLSGGTVSGGSKVFEHAGGGAGSSPSVVRLRCLWADLQRLATTCTDWGTSSGHSAGADGDNAALIAGVKAYIEAAGGSSSARSEVHQPASGGRGATTANNDATGSAGMGNAGLEVAPGKDLALHIAPPAVEDEEEIVFAPQKGRRTPSQSRAGTPALPPAALVPAAPAEASPMDEDIDAAAQRTVQGVAAQVLGIDVEGAGRDEALLGCAEPPLPPAPPSANLLFGGVFGAGNFSGALGTAVQSPPPPIFPLSPVFAQRSDDLGSGAAQRGEPVAGQQQRAEGLRALLFGVSPPERGTGGGWG